MRTLAAAALASAVLPMLSACGVGEASTAPQAAQPPATIPVVTALPERGEAFALHSGTVNLEADSEAAVVAKVGGEIVEILVEEGDRVTAGQLLARLDRERLELEVQQALADLNRLRQEYRRNVLLHERGLVSEGAFENLRFDLQALDASYRLAKLQLDYADVRAPIDGVISERISRVGNMLAPGETLFHISNPGSLVAYLHVPQRDLFHFQVGQPARLSLDALPGEQHLAVIQRISPRVDAETGTFKVTLAVDGAAASLRPGMFARVQIVYDVHANALLVPADAVLSEDAEAAVFVVEAGIARRRPVATGLISDQLVEILEGLDGTEEIIVVGHSAVQDGTPVQSHDGGHRI
jgi:membrane fusion protein (multidrug efflux system)